MLDWTAISIAFVKYSTAATGGAIFGWIRRSHTERQRVRKAIKKQLKNSEAQALIAYDQIALGQGKGTLVDKKRLEDIGTLLAQLISRLTIIEQLDDNLDKAMEIEKTGKLVNTIGCLGRFSRLYCCDGAGRNAFIELQEVGRDLQLNEFFDDVLGVPEAIQMARNYYGGGNKKNKVLITARDNAKVVIEKDVRDGKLGKDSDPDNIFLKEDWDA